MLDNALASIPVFAFLRNAPSFDPYEATRPAPPGSVPFESPTGDLLPPQLATEAGMNEFAAGRYGTNPFRPEELTVIGETAYLRHCVVCHGPQGKGDGTIMGPDKYPPGLAPDLTQPRTVARPDGYLYAIIRGGRGLMPAYGPRTTHRERWGIVVHLRKLQGQAAPPPTTTTGN
jgi:mono/diheme cytochrome c family protein